MQFKACDLMWIRTQGRESAPISEGSNYFGKTTHCRIIHWTNAAGIIMPIASLQD